MKILAVTAALLLFTFVRGPDGGSGIRAGVDARPARVEIPEQPPGRLMLQLPALEFPFRLAPRCPREMTIDSLSIAIADSRHVYRSGAFDSAATLETLLAVPAAQVAPLPLENVCTAGDPEAPRSALIPGVLTAHVSLYCVHDAGELVHYEALSLAVELACPVAADD